MGTCIKTCPDCKKNETQTEFYTSTVKHCKLCWRACTKRWREAHRPQHLAISRKCWAKNKDQYNLSRKRGGSSLYEKLLENQNGLCAICSQPEHSQRYKTLSVDHCHTSDKIRGLLCSSCNRALGLFKDNVANLQNAINYLKTNE